MSVPSANNGLNPTTDQKATIPIKVYFSPGSQVRRLYIQPNDKSYRSFDRFVSMLTDQYHSQQSIFSRDQLPLPPPAVPTIDIDLDELDSESENDEDEQGQQISSSDWITESKSARGRLQIFYQDVESDWISVNSDQEWQDAIKSFQNEQQVMENIWRLKAVVISPTGDKASREASKKRKLTAIQGEDDNEICSSEDDEDSGGQVLVSCDNCGVHLIRGERYHCKSCEDYDLCEHCYPLRNQVHDRHHEFVAIAHPRSSFMSPITLQEHQAKRKRAEFFKRGSSEQNGSITSVPFSRTGSSSASQLDNSPGSQFADQVNQFIRATVYNAGIGHYSDAVPQPVPNIHEAVTSFVHQIKRVCIKNATPGKNATKRSETTKKSATPSGTESKDTNHSKSASQASQTHTSKVVSSPSSQREQQAADAPQVDLSPENNKKERVPHREAEDEEPTIAFAYETQLEDLQKMGYENKELNQHLLNVYDGDVGLVVKYLKEGGHSQPCYIIE